MELGTFAKKKLSQLGLKDWKGLTALQQLGSNHTRISAIMTMGHPIDPIFLYCRRGLGIG